MAMPARLTVSLLVAFCFRTPFLFAAEPLKNLCTPVLSKPIVVATPAQRQAAGDRSEPSLTDSFDWPDTPLGVIRTGKSYEFFGSDGGFHARHTWDGEEVGNNKYGTVVLTTGTLDNPLGTTPPIDVGISSNIDPAVNPNYPSYGYMGGGPVFQIPEGLPHAGALLVTYHAELPNDAL